MQYVSKNVIKIGGNFGANFQKKTMGYSLYFFQKCASFKMLITPKFELKVNGKRKTDMLYLE